MCVPCDASPPIRSIGSLTRLTSLTYLAVSPITILRNRSTLGQYSFLCLTRSAPPTVGGVFVILLISFSSCVDGWISLLLIATQFLMAGGVPGLMIASPMAFCSSDSCGDGVGAGAGVGASLAAWLGLCGLAASSCGASVVSAGSSVVCPNSLLSASFMLSGSMGGTGPCGSGVGTISRSSAWNAETFVKLG